MPATQLRFDRFVLDLDRGNLRLDDAEIALAAGSAPIRTVGSYAPYARTLFDFVRRAMPFQEASALSDFANPP
jgi:hypothetical protein